MTATPTPIKNIPASSPSVHPKWGKRLVLVTVIVATALVAGGAYAIFSGGFSETEQQLIYYTVKRGDLPITITERGNLESQREVKIFCMIDDIDNDGIRGTPIRKLVPNGKAVEEGEVIIVFETTHHKERFDKQTLSEEKARKEENLAKVKLDNQKSQNETALEEAKLKVRLAKLALKQFEDEDGGTFQIDLQDIELQIQEAQAGQLIEQTNLQGVEQLYKLGYRSSGELAQARLAALKAKRALASAISKKKELVEYQYLKTKLELEGAVASGLRVQAQVERDNEAILKQVNTEWESAQKAALKEKERLERYRKQIEEDAIVKAPQSGMVSYAPPSYRREPISEGSAMYPRQHVLSIPNLQWMQVKTSVHESVLDQIAEKLPATITVDAFPNQSFRGSVASVGVLPSQENWLNQDTKNYRTIVTIDEEVSKLKPGMTAVVKIHVDRLKDVISIPVQSIVQIEDETWVYVKKNGDIERTIVKLGQSNSKFVEVKSGLSEDDRVVLNPMAILDETETNKKPLNPDDQPKPPANSGDKGKEDDDTGKSKSNANSNSARPNRRPSGSPSNTGPSGRRPRGGGGGQRPRAPRGGR